MTQVTTGSQNLASMFQMTAADLRKIFTFTHTNRSARSFEMIQEISHLFLRTDTVSLTTHVWPMDPQTKTTCVIYATQPSQNMNGLIMKVTVIYPGFATNPGTLMALTPVVYVILL